MIDHTWYSVKFLMKDLDIYFPYLVKMVFWMVLGFVCLLSIYFINFCSLLLMLEIFELDSFVCPLWTQYPIPGLTLKLLQSKVPTKLKLYLSDLLNGKGVFLLLYSFLPNLYWFFLWLWKVYVLGLTNDFIFFVSLYGQLRLHANLYITRWWFIFELH